MTIEGLHDFFVASASVAGALIGLLFVAISVAGERLSQKDETHINRVRAHAALTAFLNTLGMSLFALIPGERFGNVVLAESILGLSFVTGSLLSLVPRRGVVRGSRLFDAAFLIGLMAAFIAQLIAGLRLGASPDDAGVLRTTATLVVVFFLIGIARSWEVIGAPSTGLGHELGVQALRVIRRRRQDRSCAQDAFSEGPAASADGQAEPDNQAAEGQTESLRVEQVSSSETQDPSPCLKSGREAGVDDKLAPRAQP